MSWFSEDNSEEINNKGLLNGNFINNGNSVEDLKENVSSIDTLFHWILLMIVGNIKNF